MIHLDAGSLAAMAAVGMIAAAINAVAGGGTLLSFPLLLALGYPALVANVTNTLGLLPGYAGGSLSYRRELGGQSGRMSRLGVAAALGAVGGAILLSRTPPSAFLSIAPALILASCGLLALQPVVSRRVVGAHRASMSEGSPMLLLGCAAAGVYGAFFGGALSVILLGVFGMFIADSLQRLNALKGVVSMVVNGVAAVCFAVFAPVAWQAVAVMAPAAFVGGFAGAALARRLSPTLLRVAVIAIGVAAAIRLLV